MQPAEQPDVPSPEEERSREAGHGRELSADAQRNRQLDRALARGLGHPEPTGTLARPGYLGTLSGRPQLTTETEHALVERAKGGDEAARAELVERFLPHVAAMARTYRGSPRIQQLELVQEGVVGVLRALERYDPGRGVPFWGYASWWVRQAMQQLVAELVHPTVLSDRALRHLARLKDAHRDAVRESGREPTGDELARRTGLSDDQVADLLAVERAPRSVDEPVAGGDGEIGTFGELIADPLAEDQYEAVLRAIETEELLGLLSGLSDRERAVLRARYGLDGTERGLREIGEQLGLSAERVRQIEARALGKLAAAASDAPLRTAE